MLVNESLDTKLAGNFIEVWLSKYGKHEREKE